MGGTQGPDGGSFGMAHKTWNGPQMVCVEREREREREGKCVCECVYTTIHVCVNSCAMYT